MSTNAPQPITREIEARRPAPTPAPPPKKGTFLEGYNAGLQAQLDARNKALDQLDEARREITALRAQIEDLKARGATA